MLIVAPAVALLLLLTPGTAEHSITVVTLAIGLAPQPRATGGLSDMLQLWQSSRAARRFGDRTEVRIPCVF